MFSNTRLLAAVTGAVFLCAFAPVHGFNMNKSIEVEAGSESGGHSTVNGSITVGNGAVVDGGLETVNGTIRVDETARIEDAQTVNGSVRIASEVTARDLSSVNGSVSVGEKAIIDGEISVVNGKISLDAGASVRQDVSNVNGEIRIEGANIGGDLTTVTGDVTLENGATLDGDLIVEEAQGRNWGPRSRKPRIIVGPGTRIAGEIRLEREVELFISESAEVGGVSGVMSLADAQRFSGDRP